MKTKIISIIIVCFLISCSSNQETISNCNVDNPLENLTWLKKIKENLEKSATAWKSSITQYTYKNEAVFLVEPCKDCPDGMTSVYNCSGTIICEFGGIAGVNTCPDFSKKATNKKVLWQNYNQVIVDKKLYNSTETKYYSIKKVEVSDNLLTITISSSGCNGTTWIANLIDSGDIAESSPVQRYAKIQLKNQEACLAIVTKDFTFNISDLKVGEKNILHLEGWNKTITLK